MSMNLRVEAERDVIVCFNNQHDVQRTSFEVWQTPTAVTYTILESSDPAGWYKAWVLENSRDEDMITYAEDDPLCEREPVETTVYNAGREHVEQFDAWLQKMEENGWTVHYSAI